MKLLISRAYGTKCTCLLLVIVAICLFEFALHRQSDVFREYAAAFLSLQWMLLACLALWCGTFLFLTFNWLDLPLICLLLIAIIAYFFGKHSALDVFTFFASVTLGKGARFALNADNSWKVEDAAKDKTGKQKAECEKFSDALEIVNRKSTIVHFLVGLVGLLAFATFWHLNMSSYYHGPRWMGLWDNPNTYGMLMGAGILLSVGLLADRKWNMENVRKIGIKNFLSKILGATRVNGGKPFFFFAAVKSAMRNLQSSILFMSTGMLAVGLVMSYSRGALLGTIIGLLYLAWRYGKFIWRYVVTLTGMATASALFIWGSTPDSAPWYIKRADLGRPSAQHRATAWRAGLEIMRDHPFGLGWNNAVNVYEKNYSPPENGAAAITTNDYMMVGTELGIPALLCFIGYVALCYRKSRRLKTLISDDLSLESRMQMKSEALRAACLASALVFVVSFWFDGGLFKLPTAAMFWVLLELGAFRPQTTTIPSPALRGNN